MHSVFIGACWAVSQEAPDMYRRMVKLRRTSAKRCGRVDQADTTIV